ncbi:MAG TPA: MarR family transcriptional regulator [Acidimicrobiales bacterium]|nr:MarR family transcriptional regulator [Acidimicrobiales bacterium]
MRDDLVEAGRALATGARALERVLGDMTLAQFRVLSVVASSPERASRIATKADMSRPSLSGLLDGMVNRGWVRRCVVDADRRGVRLEVTADGHVALARAQRAVSEAMTGILVDVPADERAAVLRALVALARAFDERAAQ